MMTVNLTTTTQELEKVYADSLGCLPVIIASDLTPNDLKAIIKSHDNKIYSEVLYQLIPMHKNANDSVAFELMKADSYNNGVASALATTSNTSIHILEELMKTDDVHVLHHVKLALLRKYLNETRNNFEDTLQDFLNKEDDFSLSARYVVASHPNTPHNILIKLAEDDYDHIAQAAQRRIKGESET